jgi:hypothetical protein
MNHDELSRFALRCGVCEERSNQIKRLVMFNYLLCLLIYARCQFVTYTACGPCIRKILIRRTLVTAIPANLLFPIVALAHVMLFGVSFVPGHSRSVLKELRDKVTASKERGSPAYKTEGARGGIG